MHNLYLRFRLLYHAWKYRGVRFITLGEGRYDVMYGVGKIFGAPHPSVIIVYRWNGEPRPVALDLSEETDGYRVRPQPGDTWISLSTPAAIRQFVRIANRLASFDCEQANGPAHDEEITKA